KTSDHSATGEGLRDHTLQYEEMALAFEDEAALDSPTFDAFALPADPASLDAIGDEVSDSALPPLPAVRASSAEWLPLALDGEVTIPMDPPSGSSAKPAKMRTTAQRSPPIPWLGYIAVGLALVLVWLAATILFHR